MLFRQYNCKISSSVYRMNTNCYLSSIVALALIGGTVSTLSITKEQHNILRNVLSADQSKKYEAITIERRNHYLIGLTIGLVLSIIVVNNVRVSNYFARITLFFTITFATAAGFYTLMPKSDFMLKHLKTPEQNKKWLEMYKTMKTRYLIGIALGALIAIPIATIMC